MAGTEAFDHLAENNVILEPLPGGMIMEFSLTLLVLAALAGMVAKLIVGWDPWKLLGSLTIILLILPLLGLAFEDDPLVLQEMTDTIIERVVAEVPSVVVGEVAGVLAGAILSVFTNLFNSR